MVNVLLIFRFFYCFHGTLLSRYLSNILVTSRNHVIVLNC